MNYKDSNGVTWILVETGSQVFGTVDPESGIKYDPEPPDTAIAKAQKGDAVGERERKIVRAAIEAYAALHAKRVVLTVTAAPPGATWGVVLVVAALILWEELGEGRRRRR